MYRLLALLLLLNAVYGAAQDYKEVEGLVTRESTHAFGETRARLERAIEDAGLTLLTTVNHTKNAAGADLELRPTLLFIFGNPTVGTPLMQQMQTVGIDLPQKMLLWEDENGEVYVSYNDPAYLARRHGLEVDMTGVSDALNGLAEAATGP